MAPSATRGPAADPRPDATPAPAAEPFADFAARLGRQVDLDLTGAPPDALLLDDLGFDSLAMAEALLLLADDGVELPTDLVPELRTLGDLHHYATVLRPRPSAGEAGEVAR